MGFGSDRELLMKGGLCAEAALQPIFGTAFCQRVDATQLERRDLALAVDCRMMLVRLRCLLAYDVKYRNKEVLVAYFSARLMILVLSGSG